MDMEMRHCTEGVKVFDVSLSISSSTHTSPTQTPLTAHVQSDGGVEWPRHVRVGSAAGNHAVQVLAAQVRQGESVAGHLVGRVLAQAINERAFMPPRDLWWRTTCCGKDCRNEVRSC
ncbi:hypothetical protein E2C01_059762 [Portunus trituberculatus]|uniref:Uncharacterized protein n=1 Tax=Portunus trituberculatus TaxID=210409 RepID=A0A5B7HA69_PORTR|nr:hypothetical protein [Portunus trituberculatus]